MTKYIDEIVEIEKEFDFLPNEEIDPYPIDIFLNINSKKHNEYILTEFKDSQNRKGHERDISLNNDYEKTEDLVKAYFRSMGKIPLLSKSEEIEISKRLEEVKEIIKETVMEMPLYKRVKINLRRNGDIYIDNTDEENDKIINKSLEILDNLMKKIDTYENEKLYEFNSKRLKKSSKNKKHDALKEYKKIETIVGKNIDEIKRKYDIISKARTLYTDLKNEFITHNLRLVVNIAKRYTGRGLSLLDIIQEGNIGLIKAIDKYKYEKGFKFSTYATWWIKQTITRAIADQSKTIRIPVHILEFYYKIVKTSRELTHELGREPNIQDISNKLGVPIKKIEEILTSIQDPIALQTPVGNDDSILEELICDPNTPSPYSVTETNKTNKNINNLLNILSPREKKVIKMRFGIGYDKYYTLEEIGNHLSITRERVRQIESKAIKKLKYHNKIKRLEIFNTI